MFGKKGQFFLVAALVISGILVGLASIYTQVDAPAENTFVYDLSSELNYESLQVIDQGVYTGLSQEQLNENVLNLTDYYAEKDPKSEFIIVYGDSSSVRVREYKPTTSGTIGINSGGHSVTETVVGRTSSEHNAQVIGDNVAVRIGNYSLEFNLRPGQYFSGVIRRQDRNQTFVTKGG